MTPEFPAVMYVQIHKREDRCFAVGDHAQLHRGQVKNKSGEVVLKILRCRYANRERLYQYVNMQKNLEHPNVRQIVGMTEEGWLVSPYFPHGNILDYLKVHSDKTDKERVHLAKGILMGLAYLHSRGMIHGDVHSGDVLVDDGDVAVLCDAQLYTVTDDEKDEFCPIPSKYRWMPRERLIAEKPDDDSCVLGPPSKPADIYGVAIIIIQLWTLQRPFSCVRSVYQLIRTLQTLKSGVAQAHRPTSVPEIVWDALQGCLSVNPETRPTAEELLKKFEELYERVL